MGCFSKTGISERDLMSIACFVCNYSPGNILLIGGGCVLGETAGYRRMRGLSDDLDFIANDEGLDAVRVPLNLHDRYKNGELSEGGNITYINDILVSFFHQYIRGWPIPEELFEQPRVKHTSVGNIYTIPEELNIALKIRRGTCKRENPHVYGKDALDAATILLGMAHQSKEFDTKSFINYLLRGACLDCKLTEHGACVSTLKRSEKQLFGEDRTRYNQAMSSCELSVDNCCNK